MTPETFISRWANNTLTERAGAQAHFDDLCDLLGVEKPRDPENYCFERGAKKAGGGDGWADVWKRGCFGWENKKPGRDLNVALKQLTDYALQLENPPLLVVCDRERIIIHTAFTGYPDEPREIRITELVEPEKRQILKWVFIEPNKLRPEKSTAAITADAAGKFAEIAKRMRDRGEDSQRVAHFLVQCLFCMFAEDEELLPPDIFSSVIKSAGVDGAKAKQRLGRLFAAMQKKGGVYGNDDIPWFNGGLFKDINIPELTTADVADLHQASAEMDWRAIDPTIFGTLFERGLDPASRAPLGAHYTDTDTIEKLIKPLLQEPLHAEWETARKEIEKLSPKFGFVNARGKGKSRPNAELQRGYAVFSGFLDRLHNFRVLDPACGSGNFLYLSLKVLRDVEKRAHVDAQELGLGAELTMHTGPHNVLGLEVNEFAAELARVTVWIGDIQWCRRNGYSHATNPILRSLDGIEHRDALLYDDGSEADWPTAEVIVGNPPFIGDKVMLGELGAAYVSILRKCFKGRVPGGADFVCYWFEKARAQILAGRSKSAGFVSTNTIRGGTNRKVLDRVFNCTRIFEAWSDEAWVNEGADLRVSLIAFGATFPATRGSKLNGLEVDRIYADLTAAKDVDLAKAKRLNENIDTAYLGIQKTGAFDLPGELGRSWLGQPNPNGKPNHEVVRPWFNGLDITGRPRDKWIVDFGTRMTEAEACLYELPFAYVKKRVQPTRVGKREARTNEMWWLFQWSRPLMREAVKQLPRILVTPETPTHTVFSWLPRGVVPDKNLIVIARSDDMTFGVLSSRFHLLWVRALGAPYGNHPTARRYNSSAVFDTFPFPAGLTPKNTAAGVPTSTIAAKISAAAKHLYDTREAWLNPSDWVDWVITPEEEAAGFLKRPIAKKGKEAELKKRTLTNLYNLRPSWLDLAHKVLDEAVAEAYGWTDYSPEIPDDEILRRLLALNLKRSKTAEPAALASECIA